jgi:hypothetical protein
MKVSPTEVDQASTKIEERLVIHTTPALIHTALPDGNIDFFNRRWLEYLVSLWRTCKVGGGRHR